MEWWYTLSNDARAAIVIFAICGLTAVCIMLLWVLHDVLLQAGI